MGEWQISENMKAFLITESTGPFKVPPGITWENHPPDRCPSLPILSFTQWPELKLVTTKCLGDSQPQHVSEPPVWAV